MTKYTILFAILCYGYYTNGFGNYSIRNKKQQHLISSNIFGHIVNGVEVPVKMFPHTVQLSEAMNGVYCGGSILGKRYVLTAGHCLTFEYTDELYDPKVLTVKIGSNILGEGHEYAVCALRRHPKYNNQDYKYDLGILVTVKDMNLSPNAAIINVVNSHRWRNPKSTFMLAGFGSTESLGSMSRTLRSTVMRYVPSARCNETQLVLSPSQFMPVPQHMFCMIGTQRNSDCNGDSGSAIVWGRYQVGIVATAIEEGCGSMYMPSMYTDVFYFRNWIFKNLEHLENQKQCKRKP